MINQKIKTCWKKKKSTKSKACASKRQTSEKTWSRGKNRRDTSKQYTQSKGFQNKENSVNNKNNKFKNLNKIDNFLKILNLPKLALEETENWQNRVTDKRRDGDAEDDS